MIQKKVCMLGTFAVGKTSLVSRFVHSMFSERYQTSIGVKIDKKALQLGEEQVELILWDIHGDDEFQRIRQSYVKGASGCLFVVDGTRRSTWDEALNLSRSVRSWVGDLPCLLLLNKADLMDAWELDEDSAKPVPGFGRTVRTSAKTGEGVEEAFRILASMMLPGARSSSTSGPRGSR